MTIRSNSKYMDIISKILMSILIKVGQDFLKEIKLNIKKNPLNIAAEFLE